MNRVASYYDRQISRRQRPGAAIQVERPVDGRSERPLERAASPTAPPSAFFVRDWKSIHKGCAVFAAVAASGTLKVLAVIATVTIGIPLAALGAVAFMCGALVALVANVVAAAWCSGHGLYCDCERCACPDCREPRIACKCQSGSE